MPSIAAGHFYTGTTWYPHRGGDFCKSGDSIAPDKVSNLDYTPSSKYIKKNRLTDQNNAIFVDFNYRNCTTKDEAVIHA